MEEPLSQFIRDNFHYLLPFIIIYVLISGWAIWEREKYWEYKYNWGKTYWKVHGILLIIGLLCWAGWGLYHLIKLI